MCRTAVDLARTCIGPRDGDLGTARSEVPTGAVVHLGYGGKTDFASQQQYNDFRVQVDTLRSLGATDLMPLTELSKVPGVSWDTVTFLPGYIGAPTA